MKKLTTVFALLAIMFSTSAFANSGDKVTKAVETAFQKNFTGALNVTWEATDDFYFATFELGNKRVNAAYNEKGELVGISRKLDLSEVPLTVSQALKTQFAGYEISNLLTEIVFDGTTTYYATAEGATKTLKLKCFSDGLIYIEKRTKK